MREPQASQKPKFYPKGIFTIGNRLVPQAGRAPAVRHAADATCGRAFCPGCGVTLAARIVGEHANGREEVRILTGPPELFEGDALWVFYDKEGDIAGGRPALARGLAYVATASVADLPDLERKIERAMGMRGARYLHIHAPCPASCGAAPRDTILLARLAAESGLFPVFEAEHGAITASRKIRHRIPVADYLKPQQRFARLGGEEVARLQDIAERNIVQYDLLARARSLP